MNAPKLDEHEVIALLRRVDDGGPAVTLDVGALVQRAHRAERRRVALRGVFVTAVAAVLLGVIALAPVVRDGQVQPAQPATRSAPARHVTPPIYVSPYSRSVIAALSARFGADYDLTTTNGMIQGELYLRPGTPSAAGLPTGYLASVHVLRLDHEVVSNLCGAISAPDQTSFPCTTVTTSAGVIVYQQYTDATHAEQGGSWATLRILTPGADDSVQLADLSVVHSGNEASAADRAGAAAWLEAQSHLLIRAAVEVPLPASPKG